MPEPPSGLSKAPDRGKTTSNVHNNERTGKRSRLASSIAPEYFPVIHPRSLLRRPTVRQRFRILATLSFVLIVAAVGRAQDVVIEESTEKEFPRQITISHDTTEYTLTATGTTVRKKFFFKVYGMVHYMDDPQSGSTEELIQAVLTEEKAKQITMEFARDVGSSQIQDAYRDGFRENATAEELTGIESEVEQFAGFYTTEIQENDQLVLRWLPDGTIITVINGEEQQPITNPTFARVLWTIWFGQDSIVDPEELVALYAVEE